MGHVLMLVVAVPAHVMLPLLLPYWFSLMCRFSPPSVTPSVDCLPRQPLLLHFICRR